MLKLTKNEEKTLKLLLENARISDSLIAEKLKISSQAVGKIRKKLEKTIIKNYTINLNYAKLGIKTFAIALAKLTNFGIEKGELEIEEKLKNNKNIISVYRLPNQNPTHIILYGFQDLGELDNFFHNPKQKKELHEFIENKELFTFSNNSLIKNDPRDLFKKTIEDIKSKNKNPEFIEIENFKKRLKK